MCSLQQTPIFNSWHFPQIYWTKNQKDAFLVKNKNLKKKIFFADHGLVYLASNVGKIPKLGPLNLLKLHPNMVNMVFFPNNSRF